MGVIKKVLCSVCNKIVENDFEDSYVICGSCDTLVKMPDEFGSGVVIDDFVIEKLLGDGGMGNVYLAHEFSLDRKVALKILKNEFMSRDESRLEFINEARSVGSLNHPNIIQAHKVGEENGVVYFVMEYVEGKTLRDILKEEGPIDEMRAFSIAIDVVSAMGYAWDLRKLVHRDIKPENIMLTNDGTAKVMDLGLSIREGIDEEDEEKLKGTPQYISPEHILGTEVDVRADFYSLGITLYEMVSGKLPFQGNMREIIQAHLSQKPESLKKLVPDLDDSLVTIIKTLVAKKPENRYKNADVLLRQLRKDRKLLIDAKKGKKRFKVNTKTDIKINTPSSEIIRPKKKGRKTPLIVLMLIIVAGAGLYASNIFNADNKNKVDDSVLSNQNPLTSDTAVTTAKVDTSKSGSTAKKKKSTANNSETQKQNPKLISTDSSGKIITAIAEADARVVGNLKSNFGQETLMRLSKGRGSRTSNILMRFNLSNAPGPVKSAKFRLYVFKGNNSPSIDIDFIKNDDWEENEIIISNAPKVGKIIINKKGIDKTGPFEVDLTDIVNQELKGDKKITVLLRGGWVDIASKEHENHKFRPVLILEK